MARNCRRSESCKATRVNIATVSAASRLCREFPSNTHPQSRPRAAFRAAVALRCFPGSRRRRSFPRLRTSWRMNFCIGAIAAAARRAGSEKPKRKRPRSWFAMVSGSKRVRRHAITSSCGTGDAQLLTESLGHVQQSRFANAHRAHRCVSDRNPVHHHEAFQP